MAARLFRIQIYSSQGSVLNDQQKPVYGPYHRTGVSNIRPAKAFNVVHGGILHILKPSHIFFALALKKLVPEYSPVWRARYETSNDKLCVF